MSGQGLIMARVQSAQRTACCSQASPPAGEDLMCPTCRHKLCVDHPGSCTELGAGCLKYTLSLAHWLEHPLVEYPLRSRLTSTPDWYAAIAVKRPADLWLFKRKCSQPAASGADKPPQVAWDLLRCTSCKGTVASCGNRKHAAPWTLYSELLFFWRVGSGCPIVRFVNL